MNSKAFLAAATYIAAGCFLCFADISGSRSNAFEHKEIATMNDSQTAKKTTVFSLSRMFSSGMVLQREKTIAFFGNADHGSKLSLTFNGLTVTAVAGENGKWRAEFPPMEAGGPYELSVADESGKKLVLNDILIGDVWMCSGQSNMEMPMNSENRFWCTANAEEEVAKADDPELRFFNQSIKKFASYEEAMDDVKEGTEWQRCVPQNAEQFSACAYYFGRKLRKDLNVPIGLISCNWGGSDIQAWISKEKFEAEGYTSHIKRLKLAMEQDKAYKKWMIEVDRWLADFRKQAEETSDCVSVVQKDFDDSSWEKFDKDETFFLIRDVGRKVFRAEFFCPPEMAGKDAILELGTIRDMDITYFNGHEIGRTGTETYFYWDALRRYVVPGKYVLPGRNSLAVIAENHFISPYYSAKFTRANAVKLSSVDDRNTSCEAENWKAKVVFTADLSKIGTRAKGPIMFDGKIVHCALFNGMLNPWTQIPVKGVIWYQGCNNSGQMEYYLYNRWLIEDWRARWNEPAMPFFIVQLAGFREHNPSVRGTPDAERLVPPAENPPFPLTREIQSEMRGILPNVGLATAIDVGDEYDVHPRDKKSVGERLALEAERIAYGMDVISQGPEFDHMVREGSSIRVFFKNTFGGLSTKDGKAPGAFILKDRTGKLVWAEAKIEGDTVVVSSPEMTDPVHVRYAYAGYCGDANLVNKAGLPALPFRSDKADYTECRFLKL